MFHEVRLGRAWKGFLIIPAVLLVVLGAQYFLLKELAVFNTALGTLLLAWYLSLSAIALGLVIFIVLLAYRRIKNEVMKASESEYGEVRGLWLGIRIFFSIIIVVSCFLSFKFGVDYGIGMDVPFSWVMRKTGFDILRLHYLDGWVIWFTIILAFLFLLSDPRVTYRRGVDGRRHLYIHSKVLGFLRLLSFKEKVGGSLDYPIMVREDGRFRFNDWVRLWPYGALWSLVKFILGLAVASYLARDFALRFLMCMNYLDRLEVSAFEVFKNYLGVMAYRLSLNVVTSPSFPIEHVFTFEFFKFLYPFLTWFSVIWIIRLAIGSIAEASTPLFGGHGLRSASNTLSNIFLIFALITLLFTVTIPTWVFYAATPYNALTLILAFITLAILAFLLHVTIKPLEGWLKLLAKEEVGGKALAMLIVILLIFSVLGPSLLSKIAVEPYIQGRQYDYVWVPALIPTICFTNWAYETDGVSRVDAKMIATPTMEIMRNVRLFTLEAAKLNMKPLVGVSWMSIDPADVDIVYINGREYWVSILTLVRPPYPGDVDVWRANHIILTHSERILGVDALSTEAVDVGRMLNFTETPRIYYGEGGLWREVKEIYLNIRGFREMHLEDYRGPEAYDDEPDYVYKGFWRLWKFGWMWRWDFALGDYGDIKTLTFRDLKERISKILLPNIMVEPDGYPVIDPQGNIYMLYWTWISWRPPHEYCDWPEHSQNEVLRRFSIILVNMKNGRVEGYLMNKERDDYILSFYRSWYRQWDKPLPEWLLSQLRYPEEFLKKQIDVYNWYFQTDFTKWQSNIFYEQTIGARNKVIEDVRYITVPIDGVPTWCAVRLVEWYKSPSRNLAGMYLAPGGEKTGKLYFIDFKDVTVIGPWMAISAVNNNPQIKAQLTLHPNWVPGNILMYSIAGQLYYIIPYNAWQENFVLPAMVTVVNALDQRTGFYVIQNPKDNKEVEMAATYALQNLGATVAMPEEKEVAGTLAYKHEYVVGGNTRWILGIRIGNDTMVEVLAKAEALEQEYINKILRLKVGDAIIVVVDQNNIVKRVP